LLAPLFFAAVVPVAACGKDKPDPQNTWDKPAASASAATSPSASAASTAQAAAAAAVGDLVDGAKLQAFLPTPGLDGTTDRSVRPAKPGVAEATYKNAKGDVVTLTISDTAAVPAARDAYKAATEKVDPWPLKTSGYGKSSVLVGDRFEVTAAGPGLKPEQRKAWLAKVDLAGLAAAAK
jgi:hypothetical protein